MRDFLPADVRKRNYVINIIKEVYESYGFEPLETPAVENIETLLGKYGEEGNQLIFRVLKRGDKLDKDLKALRETGIMPGSVLGERITPEGRFADLALRYDLTVPLARVVANHKNDLPKFFKRYQIQPVWRADRPARGRFREFYQCDVDCIGSDSIVIEAELISAVSEIMEKLGFDDFLVKVNNRQLLAGILEASGIPQNRVAETIIILDKLDKIEVDGVLNELEQIGINLAEIGTFTNFIAAIFKQRQELLESEGPHVANQFTIDQIAKFAGNCANGREGLVTLVSIMDLVGRAGMGDKLWADPVLARGLSYYTGTIMEIVLMRKDFQGSMGGGGRYDGLIGMFGKEQIPACGFSLGLERILVVMEERGMFPPEIAASNSADVMVTIWNDETIGESLKLANELRKKGLRVTVYPEADKLGKQIKYADSIGVPFVCVLGESEIADGTVTLKNMQTGEQQTLTRAEVASKITK